MLLEKMEFDNLKKGKIITPIKNSDGYYQLKLCKNGKNHTKRVHVIVAEHFLENQLIMKIFSMKSIIKILIEKIIRLITWNI